MTHKSHKISSLGTIAYDKPWFVLHLRDRDHYPVDLRIERKDLIKLADHIKQALEIYPEKVARSSKDTSKATELARKEIDRVADQSATAQDRASRKRRLLKGPKEFRDMRRDHPTKAKD